MEEEAAAAVVVAVAAEGEGQVEEGGEGAAEGAAADEGTAEVREASPRTALPKQLPLSLWVRVLSRLKAVSVLSLSCTCHGFRQLVDSDVVWAALMRAHNVAIPPVLRANRVKSSVLPRVRALLLSRRQPSLRHLYLHLRRARNACLASITGLRRRIRFHHKEAASFAWSCSFHEAKGLLVRATQSDIVVRPLATPGVAWQVARFGDALGVVGCWSDGYHVLIGEGRDGCITSVILADLCPVEHVEYPDEAPVRLHIRSRHHIPAHVAGRFPHLAAVLWSPVYACLEFHSGDKSADHITSACLYCLSIDSGEMVSCHIPSCPMPTNRGSVFIGQKKLFFLTTEAWDSTGSEDSFDTDVARLAPLWLNVHRLPDLNKVIARYEIRGSLPSFRIGLTHVSSAFHRVVCLVANVVCGGIGESWTEVHVFIMHCDDDALILLAKFRMKGTSSEKCWAVMDRERVVAMGRKWMDFRRARGNHRLFKIRLKTERFSAAMCGAVGHRAIVVGYNTNEVEVMLFQPDPAPTTSVAIEGVQACDMSFYHSPFLSSLNPIDG